MIRTYVLRNFKRRKVRTILMVLALVVGVGTLVALNATVDAYRRFYAGTVSGEVGDFDLLITRPDTAPSPYLDPGRLVPEVQAVEGVNAVAPRVHGVASIRAGDKDGDSGLFALLPETDAFGSVEATEGDYDLSTVDGVPGAFVLQQTADVLGLEVGDAVELQYAPPRTRLEGQAADESGSRQRTTARWEVRGIGTQRGVTGASGNDGVIIHLDSARERFGLGVLAERLAVDFDRDLYDSSDPQRSAFRTRAVTTEIRDRLGEEDLVYTMPRPRAMIDGAQGFIFLQSLITVYGLLSLSVVGMLIRTLVMTNVQEQTRDMALLRILGAPRRHLFRMVAAEVGAIGGIGVAIGILVGLLVTNLAIVPFMARWAGEEALGGGPLLSPSAIVIAVLVAGVVLAISAFSPAQKAANTKITHAINPGVAEGIGLDDLEKMRERRTDLRISGAGLVVLTYPLLIFFAFPLAFDFGVLWALAGLILGSLLAMIVGAALVFFIIILPFERLLVWLLTRVTPRTGFFVKRTLLRGKVRNTLISLMIVMSATLPTFLSTSLALEVANTDTDRRLNGGAAFRLIPPSTIGFSPGEGPTAQVAENFRLDILAQLRDEPGFGATVARAEDFRSELSDGVGLRDARVRVTAVDADLREVLYPEAIEIIEGSPEALARVLEQEDGAIIGAGLATYFDVVPGDRLKLEGEGLDHEETIEVLAVAQRIGGVGTYTAKQTAIWSGDSTVLMGMDGYRRLVNDPFQGPPDPNARLVRTLLATPAAGMDEKELTSDLRLRYATEHGIGIDSTEETIETIREEARTGQIFLVILTALTSVLAVFGVFAVIYVSIYGRRSEIGMMKAIGSPRRHLLRVFVGEAMIMTLSSTLTGVVAGIILAYALRLSEGFRNEVPTQFAIDPIVIGAILILMILSSLVSATVATHSYRRRKAIEILRTV